MSLNITKLLTNPYQTKSYKTLIKKVLFPNHCDWFSSKSEGYNDNEDVEHIHQLGRIELEDELIPIFEVKLKKDLKKITRNRVGLRNIIRKLMRDSSSDNAIAVFYDATTPQWRFSFIAQQSTMTEDGDFINTETDSKRYTYVFGEGETVRTAKACFEKLQENPTPTIDDIIETFSVEKVSKAFFADYIKQYNKFCDFLYASPYAKSVFYIKETDDDATLKKKQKKIRDFVKKTLGRIVFLYFLQKKGWMGVPLDSTKWENGEPNFLKRLFEECSNQDKFYSQYLTTLFFDTLNNQNRGADDKYDAPWAAVRVPFLNGGLFEKNGGRTHTIDFPVEYFQSLFDFFAQYNFTIDENRLDEHEVGIDPEMLGHIFENLLEDNKDKGAFYTPKEIVHYMCQESLIQYLVTHFPTIEEQDISYFVRTKNTDKDSLQPHLKAIGKRLDTVKICDPAIGSGAFPMGLLHEIYECKMALDTNGFNAAKTKQAIIQNSIYGVDLDKGAVDIAQLRFWLSLVVEEEVPSPLPNLDYKIMQGNSLLESFDGIDLSKIIETPNDAGKVVQITDLFGMKMGKQSQIYFDKPKLDKLIKDYYSLKSKTDKTLAKKAIDGYVFDHLRTSCNKERDAKRKQCKDIRKEQNKILKGLTPKQKAKVATSAKYKRAEKNYLKILKELEAIEQTLENLLLEQQKEERNFFLWHLYFKDVFDEGGFDIVIGNPPYIQLQKMGVEADKLKAENYKTFARTGDIYCLFYEQGMNVLAEKGVLSYITPNKWMQAGYGKPLRKFLLTTCINNIVDFGDLQLFENATTYPCIVQISKSNTPKPFYSTLVQTLKFDSLNNYVRQQKTTMDVNDLNEETWIICSKEDLAILKKIKNNCISLENYVGDSSYRGIVTGLTEAFIMNQQQYEKIINKDKASKKLLKPVLRGRDVEKWSASSKNIYLIGIFPTLRLNIENYQGIKQHLLKWGKARLEQTGKKGSRKKTSGKWFETQDSITYWEEFEKPKIMYQVFQVKPCFIYDDAGLYCNNSMWIIPKDDKALVAILNSKMGWWLISKYCTAIQRGYQLIWKYFSKIAIPKFSEEQAKPIIEFVNKIIALKKANQDTTALEQKIDLMVYKLYELSYEEVLIVQSDFGDYMNKENYENYTIN